MDAPQPYGPYAPHQPQHQPQPWPGQPAPPPGRWNGMAVGALGAAVVLLFPLALVLGVIALSRLAGPARGQRGRGLAVAALALAGAEVAALSVLVPVRVMNADAADDGRPTASASPPGRDDAAGGDGGDDGDAGGEEVSLFNLRVGDCFDTGSGLGGYGQDHATPEHSVTRLPCGVPHEAEAFGAATVSGYDAFPGDEELTALANEECGRLLQPYVVDLWALPAEIQTFFYYPQEASWRLGDREILCAFGRADGEALTASLRGDESEMSPEQLRYLEITTPLEVLVWNEPMEGDLAVLREWADRMADAVVAEAEALRGEEWSSAVSGLVMDLAVVREAGAEHWERAALARNMTEYEGYKDDGYAALGIAEEIAVRDALGLATGE